MISAPLSHGSPLFFAERREAIPKKPDSGGQHRHHRRAHGDPAGLPQLGEGVVRLHRDACRRAAGGHRLGDGGSASQARYTRLARPSRIALRDCFTPTTFSWEASSVSTGIPPETHGKIREFSISAHFWIIPWRRSPVKTFFHEKFRRAQTFPAAPPPFLQRSLFPAGTATGAAHGAQSFTVPRP